DGAGAMGELAWREFRRIELLDMQSARFLHRLKVEAHGLGTGEQQADLLVENENGGRFAPADGRLDELQGDQGLARAGRAEDQGTGPLGQTATQKPVEFGNVAGLLIAQELRAMFERDQTRVDLDTAG